MFSTRHKSLAIATIMILIAALTRFIPHYPNFTALGGMALFSSAFISRKTWALLVPLFALFLSDLVLNNTIFASYYEGFKMFGDVWVYAGIALMIVIGKFLFSKKTASRFVVTSLIATIAFFIITNFGSWVGPFSVTPKTFAGLITTYEIAVPFFWNTLAGNLFYGAILFGVFHWVQSNVLSKEMDTQTNTVTV